jgi:hypothetical protein
MAKHLGADSLLAERLLLEHALRELRELRTAPKSRALQKLRELVLVLRQLEEQAALSSDPAAKTREEAILAIGLIGITLDRRIRRASELDALWENAVARVSAWLAAMTPKAATSSRR